MAVAVAGALAIVLVSAKASIERDDAGLARIGMPLGGGRIVSMSVIGGRGRKPVPVRVTDGLLIIAKRPVPANEHLRIRVVIRRPGWISWLGGKHQTLTLSYVTPTASATTHYLTVRKGSRLRLRFKAPIEAYEVGTEPAQAHPPRAALAGEQRAPAAVRSGGIVVRGRADPPVGEVPDRADQLLPRRRVRQRRRGTGARDPDHSGDADPDQLLTAGRQGARATRMPTLVPATSGSWKRVSDRAIEFTPTGYGYGLNARVQVVLPGGVRLVGGQSGSCELR